METPPAYKKILTIYSCITGMAVTVAVILTIILIRTIHQNYMVLQQFKDEQERKDESATGRIMAEIQMIHEEITGIQEILGAVLEAVGRSAGENREGEIIGMLAEKLAYDYTEKALEYFRRADYANAFNVFTRALQRQRRNTTLQFYQAYALYLRQRDEALSDGEWVVLQGLIRDLQGIRFRTQEQLDFTVEEMDQKLKEMEYNMVAMRQRMGSNGVNKKDAGGEW